jgi:uncharacterized membrane protein
MKGFSRWLYPGNVAVIIIFILIVTAISCVLASCYYAGWSGGTHGYEEVRHVGKILDATFMVFFVTTISTLVVNIIMCRRQRKLLDLKFKEQNPTLVGYMYNWHTVELWLDNGVPDFSK